MKDDASLPPGPQRAPAARDNTVLDWARDEGAGDLLIVGLDRYLRRRRRQRIALAATAGVVLLVAGMAWFPVREAAADAPVSTAIAGATILRPEQRTLADGSTIDLNVGAEIDVTLGDSFRRVVLRRGEAHFKVAKDANRPFIVTAGSIEVHAVGTAFAVDMRSSAVDVLVTEGRVAVNATAPSGTIGRTNPISPAPPPLAALGAGGRVVIERKVSATASLVPRISKLSAADVRARLAWRVPRLKFAATPLPRVVEMFNEHAVAGRDARLVMAIDIPANLRVSGMLRADDVDSLLRLLAGEFGISAETQGGEIVLHRR